MTQQSGEIADRADDTGPDQAILGLQDHHERRATLRARDDWRDACGDDALPHLTGLPTGDMKGQWRDRFLIRNDPDIARAVFVACGDGVQTDWDLDRLGVTIEDTLPETLSAPFAEACQMSLETSGPVPFSGRYRDGTEREYLFRCIMMPVLSQNDEVDFIYGAYSQKRAA